MKKIVSFLLPLILFSACQESLEKRAARTLQDYTEKNCPMQLSETIMMDSCAFEPEGHIMHYYYTLMGAMDNDSTLNKEAMRKLLVEALRNETSTRTYKEAGYSFNYSYYSQKERGKLIFETTMTTEDYSN